MRVYRHPIASDGTTLVLHMSDKTHASDISSDKNDTQKQSANTSKILFDDLHSGKIIGKFSLDGQVTACKTNPGEGKVPTLIAGRDSHGCDYKGAKNLPKELRHLDFADLYNQAAQSTMRIDATMRPPGDKNPKHKMDGPIGTGSIIGKDLQNGECLVLTANHVAKGTKDIAISNARAVSADGKTYPSEIRFSDAKHDRAVLAIKTGEDTEKTCKPFTAAKDANKEAAEAKSLIALGFAEGSRALYASPGKSEGIYKILDVMGPKEFKQFGLDRNAAGVVIDNHVRGGQSGGPVVTDTGKLIGINQFAMSETEGSIALPIDQQSIDYLIRKSQKPQKH